MLKEIIKEQQEEIKPTIEALENFRKAYLQLLNVWYGNEILDNTESLKDYPFDNSFDELNVCGWIESTIEEIKSASN